MNSDDSPQLGQVSSGSAESTLADKIEWLIKNMWPPEAERASSLDGVATAIREATGEQQISRGTISNLLNGKQTNPTLRTLTAIAGFFRVPIGYFGNDAHADSIGGQLTMLALLRDGGIAHAALRNLVDLSPEGKKMIEEMIASAAKMEQSRSIWPSQPGQDAVASSE